MLAAVDEEVSDIESCTLDLIDHIMSSNAKKRSSSSNSSNEGHPVQPNHFGESKMTWDGRKGQWIPQIYAFKFPLDAFDHIQEGLVVNVRPLASFSFPPSKRFSIMLDQSTPKFRKIERSMATHVRRKTPMTRFRNEEDPFEMNRVGRNQTPIGWLDDMNIQDFIKRTDYFSTSSGGSSGKGYSPCTPSSPPPPLFPISDANSTSSSSFHLPFSPLPNKRMNSSASMFHLTSALI